MSNKDYIIFTHPLKSFGNVFCFGLHFCSGVAVLDKNSREYIKAKKVKFFSKSKEVPLEFLGRFGFRPHDIKLVFGRDIYLAYQEKIKTLPKNLNTQPETVVSQVEESEKPVKTNDFYDSELTLEQNIDMYKAAERCYYLKSDETLCGGKAIKSSPSGYCLGHLRMDQLIKRG
jgi:hypothetical protein